MPADSQPRKSELDAAATAEAQLLEIKSFAIHNGWRVVGPFTMHMEEHGERIPIRYIDCTSPDHRFKTMYSFRLTTDDWYPALSIARPENLALSLQFTRPRSRQ